jgi:hypothetical protein
MLTTEQKVRVRERMQKWTNDCIARGVVPVILLASPTEKDEGMVVCAIDIYDWPDVAQILRNVANDPEVNQVS